MRNNREQVELWERSLATLDDAVFLDIAKNFIGRIPTPFHKPLIIDRLTTLFSSEEFVRQVKLSLSDLDRQLLAGTALLGSVTQDQLCSLFSGTRAYANLQQGVVNLEERLLLVPDPDTFGRNASVMINPLLARELLEDSIDIGDLLDEHLDPRGSRHVKLQRVDRRLIRALASLHLHGNLGTIEKSERLLTSKIAVQVFSLTDPLAVERLLAVNRMLFHQGVVTTRGKRTSFNLARTSALLESSDETLSWLLFVAAWSRTRPVPDIANLGRFYSTIKILLDRTKVSEDSALVRLGTIACIRSNLPVENMEDLVHLLHVAGIGTAEHASGALVHMPPTIDSDLTISFTSDVDPVEGKDLLHLIALVRKVDVVTSYEVNRSTMLRAFDVGLTIDEIRTYLLGLTGSLPGNLGRLISQWKDEFSAITIYDGIVVKTDDRLGRILKALPSLRGHLVGTISENTFLFSRTTEHLWRDIIASTGIGLLPSSICANEEHFYESSHEVPVPESDPLLLHTLTALEQRSRTNEGHERSSFLEHLRHAIHEKGLTRSEREELLARLERKLILVPSQIAASDGRTQTMEASGFDYQGKVNLCKATINTPAYLLELHLLDAKGESQILMTEVKELIKDGKEAAIRVRILPHGEEKVLSVGKIFRMRRLRRSIFLQV